MLIIILIAITHYFITNVFEKTLFQFLNYEKSKRPQSNCTTNESIYCQGMPSGHVEIVTIILILCYYKYSLNGWIIAIIIIIVAAQRIFFKWHTLLQVFIGFIFGVVYGLIYATSSMYLFLIFPIIYCIVITLILNKKLNEKIPSWVDTRLYYIFKKKTKNIWFIDKMKCVMLLLLSHKHSIYCSWKTLEKHADNLIKILRNTSKYDIVVGIKSGGAIVSNYVAMKLVLPNYYMKIASNCDKTFNQSFIEFVNKYIIKKKITDYKVCEELNINVMNANVLLIDESVGSGNTMRVCRDHLLQKGAKSVTLACIDDIKISNLDLFVASNENYIVWPWGYDN